MSFPYTFPFKFIEFTRITDITLSARANHNIEVVVGQSHNITSRAWSAHSILMAFYQNHALSPQARTHHTIRRMAYD